MDMFRTRGELYSKFMNDKDYFKNICKIKNM